MNRKGNCWNNAVVESFVATLKNKETIGVMETKAAVHVAITSYICRFCKPIRCTPYPSPSDYAMKLKLAA